MAERNGRALAVGGLLGAMVWLGVGLAGLLEPAWLLGQAGIELRGVDAHNEARAIYGGLMLALGGVQAALALRDGWRRIGIALWTVLLAGLVTGRLWSLIVDGWPAGVARLLLAVEVAGLLMGAVLWAASRPARGATRSNHRL